MSIKVRFARRLIIFLAFCFPLLASADSQPPRTKGKAEALATRLVALLQIEDLYREMHSLCIDKATGSWSSELMEAYRSSPADFGGIAPGSKYWSEVEHLYRRNKMALCATSDKIIPIYVAAFAKLPVADLEKMVAVYQTPAGKRMLEANARANRESNTFVATELQNEIKIARDEFQRDFGALVARSKRENQRQR